MPDPFTISLTQVVRALPQTPRIIPGHPQPPVLARFVAGDLKLAAHLGALFDALLDRSLTDAEQDEADVVVEHIALEWQARKDARRRAQARADWLAVSRGEEAANHRLNDTQLQAHPGAPASAWHAVYRAALHQMARTRDLLMAARAQMEWR
jgi:hypothetical protein